jgi:hypothetical protein
MDISFLVRVKPVTRLYRSPKIGGVVASSFVLCPEYVVGAQPKTAFIGDVPPAQLLHDLAEECLHSH